MVHKNPYWCIQILKPAFKSLRTFPPHERNLAGQPDRKRNFKVKIGETSLTNCFFKVLNYLFSKAFTELFHCI